MNRIKAADQLNTEANQLRLRSIVREHGHHESEARKYTVSVIYDPKEGTVQVDALNEEYEAFRAFFAIQSAYALHDALCKLFAEEP